MGNTKQKVIKNLFWRLVERYAAQIVQFIVSIVLARILLPEIYGIVALALVFITILQVFVDSGLGTALIQKKDADDLDFSTVFWFNVFFCGILYLGIFFAAPLIANFYRQEQLTNVIRVLSIVLIFSSLKNVQHAYVSKHMQFRKFFWATIVGTIASAVVGIVMAKNGYGVWAIVVQHLVNTGLDTFILWLSVKWRPKFKFSWQRLKLLFRYGWKLLVSAIIDVTYNNLRQLIIGKKYSEADLAYYHKGDQFPAFIVTGINASIDSVMLPTLSQAQDNVEQVRNMTSRSIKTSSYIMAPLMIGLAVTAQGVVKLLLGDNWLPCVPILQILCISYMFYPIHTANLNAIKALGRSDLFLILEIVKKIVGLTLLFSTFWISVQAMAISLLVSSVLGQIINSWPNKKLLNYSFIRQVKDVLPNFVLAGFMGICVWLIAFIPLNYIVILFIQVATGALIYLIGSLLTKNDSFNYCIGAVKDFFRKDRAVVQPIKEEQAEKRGSEEKLKLGIMQPYFVPYIGYWQLLNAVDKYVIYDDVNFIKGGWINRNRILLDGKPFYFNVQMNGASPNKLINEVQINNNPAFIKKSLKQIEMAYKKAPYYAVVSPLFEEILTYQTNNLVEFIVHSFKVINNYLGIDTELILSSSLDKDCTLRGQEKVIAICKLLGATEYYNAIGGQELYNFEDFSNNNIELKFLQTEEIVYKQFNNEFQANLSIIDVLMFNDKEKVKEMLNKYKLISKSEGKEE